MLDYEKLELGSIVYFAESVSNDAETFYSFHDGHWWERSVYGRVQYQPKPYKVVNKTRTVDGYGAVEERFEYEHNQYGETLTSSIHSERYFHTLEECERWIAQNTTHPDLYFVPNEDTIKDDRGR